MTTLLLAARSLSLTRGQQRLFHQLNLHLKAGELLQVLGPNGSGKTSLLQVLAGLRMPDEGTVQWQESASLYYLGHQLALKSHLTVEENIEFNFFGIVEQAQKHFYLNALGLASLQSRRCETLSAGQQKKVAIVKLLLAKAAVWVLVEPLINLDDPSQHWVEEQALFHLAAGGGIILSTHQPLKQLGGWGAGRIHLFEERTETWFL
ncbi:MAG TPA: heme ABC exporter ATP-binding protein CcmA [Coxiellaceae bacterium]|nr:heme ABC exporter ATP-binding protein CcmA [Coxiellaceae bacterium]